MKKLPRRFYNRNTIIVAKELLGKYLIHQSNGIKQIGKIVEVEAYLGAHDLASHTAKGLTARTRIMFGPPGYAYVYLIYGMYYCMNVVTEGEGQGSAILLRALEPIKNISTKTTGPGLLCKAMNINKMHNGQDLCGPKLYIASNTASAPFKIAKTPRIGVDYAKHWAKRHLRFYIKDNPFVSKLRKIHGSK
jgi:DNA-3-methyladenine glycosylase